MPKSTRQICIALAAAAFSAVAAGFIVPLKAAPVPQENPKRDLAAIKNAVAKVAARQQKGLLAVPDAGSKQESEHNARLDKAIKPLRDIEVSESDAAAIRGANKAVRKKDYVGALAHQSAISDPVGRKLVDWMLLRSGQGTIETYEKFLAENPLWPNRWLLIEKLEAKLFEGKNHRQTLAHFANAEPESSAGKMALAAAKKASGDVAGARALASATWRDDDIPADLEKPILARLGDLISAADHKWRLDRLLTRDFRWRASRKRHAAIVSRQIPRVSKAEQQKARARLAVFNRSKSARKLMNALPKGAQNDWSLAYHRVQHLRRAKKKSAAAKLLLSAPTDKAQIVNPDAWWVERRINAYSALDQGNPKLAYKLVREAGPLTVNPRKEQAFTAGWLALRYLGDVDAALKHFKVMVDAADGPLSRAKSNYWMGRALDAAGRKAEAQDSYRRATREFDTFHGHLARQQMAGGKPMTIEITPPEAPTAEQVSRFRGYDAAKAAVIAAKLGLGRSISRPFLANLANQLETEAEVAMVAHLTRGLDDTQQSLRIGKRAIARGMNLTYYSYPLHAFPDYKPLRTPPEPAFLLGIARQESEFNTAIVSGAGAKGILQVMTITAKHVCRDYKIKCQISRLRTDEAYNTKIASAYIADRMEEFRGSYVLGLAGYNAGPGRARQWIKRFGDPRDGRIDPIDWIERIPFKETRNYVGKVLSNIQIYRARLQEPRKHLRIMQDLARAQAGTRSTRPLVAPGALVSQ